MKQEVSEAIIYAIRNILIDFWFKIVCEICNGKAELLTEFENFLDFLKFFKIVKSV